MRGYRSRLDPVLRVRRKEEEVARAALLRAGAAVEDARALLARRTASYDRVHTLQSGLGPAEFLGEQAHRAALGAALVDQRARLQAAQDDEERARQHWTAAASRVGALERLEERRRAEHGAAVRKEEELSVDELVVSRHGRGDR